MIKKLLLLFLVTAFVAGCARAPKTALLLDSQFDRLDIRQVELGPVVMADKSLDRYFEGIIAEEILWHTERVLSAKGYEVVRATEAAMPRTVLNIRIDHFLDRGLYGRSQLPVELYATATLMTDDRIVWKGEGVGRGEASPLAHYTRRMEWFLAPSSLADSLFASLPAVN
jgi:hypothetical protein